MLNELEKELREDLRFFEFMDSFSVSGRGSIKDAFGGTLFYAYRKPPQQPTWRTTEGTRSLVQSHFAEAEMQAVEEMLPEARRFVEKRFTEKLQQAVKDLELESLYPIYTALGRQYKALEVDRWRLKSTAKQRTLEDGSVVRRPVKGNLPSNFPPLVNEEWPRERLEAALRDAEFFLKPSNVTLEKTAEVISQKWAPGTTITGFSLQKMLERKGIKWRERKKEMIVRIKIRHERHNGRATSENSKKQR